MALPQDPDKLVVHLLTDLFRNERALKKADQYYEGQQPLRYMAPALEAELGDRITQMVINWPRLGADAYENRLDVVGFRYAATGGGDVDDDLDEEIWGGWLANDMDEASGQAHLEALITGRSYAIVGAGDTPDDDPLITVEHPTQVFAVDDPRTRRVLTGVKRWRDEYDTDRATLYLPDGTRHYALGRGNWREIAEQRDEHQLGAPPMVRLLNRGRMLNKLGVSEFADVIPIADAANKMATDMMISGEFHAMPRRWVFGMDESDFQDENGNQLSSWEQIAGRLWATDKSPKDVAAGQFPESDLTVFHNTIKLLAQVAGQMLALPPHYMMFASDNPASADAIRSSEAQMVKRAERKQRTFGAGHKQTMRLWHRIKTGRWDERLMRLETVWRDAATPTVAQAADAAVKKRQQGIVPLKQTRIDLGYSPGQIDAMEAEDAREADLDPLGDMTRRVGQQEPSELQE